MLSAEIFTQHAKCSYKNVFKACNDELLLHSNSAGQDQSVHQHSLIWIFSGLSLAIHLIYSIHYFCKRTKVLIRMKDDKVFR